MFIIIYIYIKSKYYVYMMIRGYGINQSNHENQLNKQWNWTFQLDFFGSFALNCIFDIYNRRKNKRLFQSLFNH